MGCGAPCWHTRTEVRWGLDGHTGMGCIRYLPSVSFKELDLGGQLLGHHV